MTEYFTLLQRRLRAAGLRESAAICVKGDEGAALLLALEVNWAEHSAIEFVPLRDILRAFCSGRLALLQYRSGLIDITIEWQMKGGDVTSLREIDRLAEELMLLAADRERAGHMAGTLVRTPPPGGKKRFFVKRDA